MKKIIAALILAVLICVIRSVVHLPFPHFPGKKPDTEATPQEVNPLSSGSTVTGDTLTVQLYYPYADSGLLGCESAELDIRRENTVAYGIVERLLEGPGLAYDRLSNPFPSDTKLISLTMEEQTAYVVLSREFLGKPDDAPSDWEDSPVWQEKAAHLRTLAVQSIVLALTENARCQQVQVLTAMSENDPSERIDIAWFDPENDSHAMLGKLTRDESFLITPYKAMEKLMNAWQNRDWEALYCWIAPEERENLVTRGEFISGMEDSEATLLSWSCTQGNVNSDGQHATMVMDVLLHTPYGNAQLERRSVMMVRCEDNWCIRLSSLNDLTTVD